MLLPLLGLPSQTHDACLLFLDPVTVQYKIFTSNVVLHYFIIDLFLYHHVSECFRLLDSIMN